MGKETKLDPTAWAPHKHRHIFAKLFVTVLLVGLSFRLFFNRSPGFESPLAARKAESPAEARNLDFRTGSSSTEKAGSFVTSTNESTGDMQDQDASTGKCDLFTGEWIPNPSGPVYTNETCTIVEDHQNCIKNGRSDSGYLFWRWKPRDCEIPLFNAEKFLKAMRNKSWAFIGDSISRNHVQSMVCLLSKAEPAVETYHDKEFRSKKWKFSSYNFTIAVIWSPFLIKAEIFEDMNGVSTSEIQLHLDALDKTWTDEFHDFDYIITSGGKWFLKTAIYWENETIIGCHYCPGKNLTEHGFDYAYRRALNLVLNFFTTSGYKGIVLFRTSTPDHFENGEWHNGGTCNRTVPFNEGDVKMTDVDRIMRTIELEEFEKAAMAESVNGVVLKLLDTTGLSLLRPDGHPGPYRQYHPFASNKNAKVQNDCLHWCLPGPIDSWNDIVMEMVLNG